MGDEFTWNIGKSGKNCRSKFEEWKKRESNKAIVKLYGAANGFEGNIQRISKVRLRIHEAKSLIIDKKFATGLIYGRSNRVISKAENKTLRQWLWGKDPTNPTETWTWPYNHRNKGSRSMKTKVYSMYFATSMLKISLMAICTEESFAEIEGETHRFVFCHLSKRTVKN